MKKAVIQLDTLTCPSCALKIEGALEALPGITKENVSVLFNASKVKLDFDESKVNITAIEKAISTLGYDVVKSQVKD